MSSGMISKMLENAAEGEEEDVEVCLPQFDAATVARVAQYCVHYEQEPMADIEKPIDSCNMADLVQLWYADFVDLEGRPLFNLLSAANFMDIPPLLSLACAKIASFIKDMTPEQSRMRFEAMSR